MKVLDSILAPARSLDWHDPEAVAVVSRGVLTELGAQPSLLSELLDRAGSMPELSALCEHYDILDKIVLHDDETGFRIRLHIFGPGYFDRPHNHRWIYSSLILRGTYLHKIYAANGPIDTLEGLPLLVPLMTRVEKPGDFYTLGTKAVHSITAEPLTTTLILRGPTESSRFFVMDSATGKAWWQYGAKDESSEERQAKAMSAERLVELSALVKSRLSAETALI